MDAPASLLDGPRAHGAFLLRALFEPPWSVRIEDRATLSLVAMVQGTAWIMPAAGSRLELGPGDVAILRGPDPYTFADDPTTEPQAVIHPGQRCTTPAGDDLHDAMTLGVRSWGNSPYGSTIFLVGTYEMPAATNQRLLATLPPVLALSHNAIDTPLIALLDDEIVKEEPGQEVVLDRMLDLLLITTLRRWFARSEVSNPAWYAAQGDPVVGKALRCLHDDPARRWTVASLATEAGVSRATLARRFTELVGEPPMSYLAEWRLALAADLLREPSATVGAVARKVGYGSSFALSAAFKRHRGIAPQQHRKLSALHPL